MISNIRKNIMGTISFDAKFPGMRKAQEFIVYPMQSIGETQITIQSDTRLGTIKLDTGALFSTPPIQGGAYSHHRPLMREIGKLDAETLFMLKAKINGTASDMAGTNGVVYCNNIGAAGVLG